VRGGRAAFLAFNKIESSSGYFHFLSRH
jgi:hypothetical protein